MQLLRALQGGDQDTADALYARFMPLENLREAISLIRVLHDAISLCALADMGAQMPLLSAVPAEHRNQIQALATELLAFEKLQADPPPAP